MMEDKTAPQEVGCSAPDQLAAMMVSAYVSNNVVPKQELPGLFTSMRDAIVDGSSHTLPSVEPAMKATKAQIEKSITPDALISFIDGKPYKTIKRHLTTHGLSVEQYRLRYGLPVDYPVVAPNYSVKRSELAKALGLGQSGRKDAA